MRLHRHAKETGAWRQVPRLRADHYSGLSERWDHGPIWCTVATGRLVCHITGVHTRHMRFLEWDTPTLIEGSSCTAIACPCFARVEGQRLLPLLHPASSTTSAPLHWKDVRDLHVFSFQLSFRLLACRRGGDGNRRTPLPRRRRAPLPPAYWQEVHPLRRHALPRLHARQRAVADLRQPRRCVSRHDVLPPQARVPSAARVRRGGRRAVRKVHRGERAKAVRP